MVANQLMEEQLMFYSNADGLKFGEKYSISDRIQVGKALSRISYVSEKKAYEMSGISPTPIDSLVSGISSLKDACEFLKSEGKSIREAIFDSAGRKELLPASEGYLMNSLILRSVGGRPSYEGELDSEPVSFGNRIVFVGNAFGWVAVKKLSLEGAQDYEISAILSSIVSTCTRKMFDFLGVDVSDDFPKGRKSLSSASNIFKKASEKSDMLEKLAFLFFGLENLKYYAYANPEMLVKAYPDVKVKKPRGRMKG